MSSFTCSNCGAAITPSQTVCAQCDSEIVWGAPIARIRHVRRLPKLGPPRGPRIGTLTGLSLGALAVLSIFLLAAVWGLERGLQERRAVITSLNPLRYVQGLQLLAGGRIEDARSEFQQVVALELRKTPTPTPTSTPTAGPTPTPVPPTPTPRFNELPLQEAINLAQTAMDNEDWQDAIRRLQTLRDLDPGFQSGLVGQMLFNAHFNQALAYEASGDIDAAAEALSAALALRPGNTAANEMRQKLELYRTGAAAMGVDWDAAITAFTELFALAPEFQGVQNQLFLAYVGSADSHLRNEPCLAKERYQLALQIEREPQVQAKLGDARLRCGDRTPVPGEATPDGATPTPTPGPIPGQIAYTFFDDDRTFHSTALWDVKTARISRVIAAESVQPDLGPNGSVVVRSTKADSFGLVYYAQPQATPERLTQDAGDSQPRLSPDGRRILFNASTRAGDGKVHVYVLERASGRVRDLGEGRGGAWSPDGAQIVYQGCRAVGEDCGLWLFTLDTANRTQLTAVQSDSMPSWSPDGRYIAFMSAGRSPSWDVFVADARTGNIPLFALDDAIDGLPVWSPDSKSIAFLTNRDGGWAVYSWSLSDLAVERLFTVPGSLPVWQEAGLDWAE